MNSWVNIVCSSTQTVGGFTLGRDGQTMSIAHNKYLILNVMLQDQLSTNS